MPKRRQTMGYIVFSHSELMTVCIYIHVIMKYERILQERKPNKSSLVFLRPRRRCCSGDTAMVEGAMVYLKYFQKSKRALKLNREASTSSINKNRKEIFNRQGFR